MAVRVFAPLQVYMHQRKKLLADDAYKKVFMNRVSDDPLGVDLQISSKPPGAEGFVPVVALGKRKNLRQL